MLSCGKVATDGVVVVGDVARPGAATVAGDATGTETAGEAGTGCVSEATTDGGPVSTNRVAVSTWGVMLPVVAEGTPAGDTGTFAAACDSAGVAAGVAADGSGD
mgnify:CR=1 FL=1